MKKLHFSIQINAPKEKVWDIMLEDKTYREWSEVFGKGSYYEGSWEKGSDIKFLAPGEDGKLSGMISKIVENIPYEFLSIKHLGIVKDGIEDTTSEETQDWIGALENYTFKGMNGVTDVVVDIDVADELEKDFNEMWPKGLWKLKEIAER